MNENGKLAFLSVLIAPGLEISFLLKSNLIRSIKSKSS